MESMSITPSFFRGVGIPPIRYTHDLNQGLVTVPFWEYWTSPKIVAIKKTIDLMVG